VLYKIKKLPSLECGDILAIMDTGAYFIPMQSNFSFPRASAVLVEGGRHKLIRQRESFETMTANDFPGQSW
jgi:diaminopimelate decarboxylase